MVAFFKLIRWPNILLMAFTQYAMRYLVIKPAIEFPEVGLSLQLSFLHFNLLVISTLLIAASGYIINDYFDLKIDRFNKPKKMLLGSFISRKSAIKYHWISSIIGLIIAFYTCYINGFFNLFYVFAFISGGLWFYSTSYKHIPLLGNAIIALMVALVPLVISVLDFKLIQETQAEILLKSGYRLVDTKALILGFSIFAFIYNLVREIVKDLADEPGDRLGNSKSIPVAWGVNTAKLISVLFTILAIVLLLFSCFNFLKDIRSFFYIIFVIVIPSLHVIYGIFQASSTDHYLKVSQTLKWILLFGMMYSILFYVNITA